MMFRNNLRLALTSIGSSKWRSFLTMLGIIVGVSSVLIIVSLGEGVKRQVEDQINHLGPDIITVRPGKAVSRDDTGTVQSVSLLTAFGGGSMAETDLEIIRRTPNVKVAVPISLVPGVARVDNRELKDGVILGTTASMPELFNQELLYGGFFNDAEDASRNFAVIGKQVAEQLFKENAPIGRAMQIRDQTFIVTGVFEEFSANPLAPGTNYNAAVFVPYEVGKKLGSGQVQIQQIVAKPNQPEQLNDVVASIDARLMNARAGQQDYTILRQADNLAIASKVVDLLTLLISSVAAISLFVGGIGIMNVMLVAVSERTREIGVRKAVGATSYQVASQFMIEAAAISLMGGFLGIVVSFVANYFIRLFTDLAPVITPQAIGLALGIAFVVGVVFGTAPALRAARKDPIESLRQY